MLKPRRKVLSNINWIFEIIENSTRNTNNNLLLACRIHPKFRIFCVLVLGNHFSLMNFKGFLISLLNNSNSYYSMRIHSLFATPCLEHKTLSSLPFLRCRHPFSNNKCMPTIWRNVLFSANVFVTSLLLCFSIIQQSYGIIHIQAPRVPHISSPQSHSNAIFWISNFDLFYFRWMPAIFSAACSYFPSHSFHYWTLYWQYTNDLDILLWVQANHGQCHANDLNLDWNSVCAGGGGDIGGLYIIGTFECGWMRNSVKMDHTFCPDWNSIIFLTLLYIVLNKRNHLPLRSNVHHFVCVLELTY